MVEIIFEIYNVKSLYILNPDILWIYSTGKYNSINKMKTKHKLLYDDYLLHYSIYKLVITGRDITYYLIKILKNVI